MIHECGALRSYYCCFPDRSKKVTRTHLRMELLGLIEVPRWIVGTAIFFSTVCLWVQVNYISKNKCKVIYVICVRKLFSRHLHGIYFILFDWNLLIWRIFKLLNPVNRLNVLVALINKHNVIIICIENASSQEGQCTQFCRNFWRCCLEFGKRIIVK